MFIFIVNKDKAILFENKQFISYCQGAISAVKYQF